MRTVDECFWKRDTVETAAVLMDAAALGAATGRPVETVEGRPAVRLEAGQPLEFCPALTDWREFDQVVMVFRTAGGSIRPGLHVALATRTEGLPADDSLDTGRGPDLRAETGWSEYPFPWENFLIYGMGELVHPVKRAGVRFSPEEGTATVWVAELRVERRNRAEGPRLTDDGLAATLDGFDGPALLAHLRKRERPRSIYGQAPEKATAETIQTADGIAAHFINGYEVGRPVNWRINPNGYLEWMHKLNRHGWMKPLLAAYQATGEPKYAQALDEMWLGWIRENPEPAGHNGGGDPAWETLSTAVRVYGTWLDGFFALLDDPNFRDSTRLEILKSLYGHAEHLLAWQGHPNNWLIVESRVLFALGLLFPEFKLAGAWLAEGRARLTRELARQVWPDGADWELAPGYHMMACRGFLEPLELARLNDVALPPIFAERLPATFEYVAGMTRPDGTLPAVNDSGGWRARGGQDYLAYGARLFDRPEWRAGPEGAFAGQTRFFPDSGFHVLASGTGRDAMWSFLDGGPPGASHCHDDALNVEFFAFGLPFVVDPGITGYLRDAWTAYYRQTGSHNTVLVNGAGQDWARAAHAARTASARGRVAAAAGELADVARAVYDWAYRDQPAGLVHTRALVFVRGGYWVVFDEVRGPGAERMEARYQFVPLRLTLDRRRRVFRTLRQDRPNMEVWPIPAGGGRLALDVVTGGTDPVGGWVSDGEDWPAPQARIGLARRAETDRLRLVTVVYPFAAGVNAGMRARLRKADDGGASACLELRHADGRRDVLRYAWEDRLWAPGAGESPLAVEIGGRRARLMAADSHVFWERD